MAQRRTEKEVVKTIKAASVICTQRSYSDFILHCRVVLTEFFGFEGLGILFRDQINDNLFSIDLDERENDLSLLKLKEQKAKLKEGLTTEEAVKDAERQYRKRSTHIYPNSLGLTG